MRTPSPDASPSAADAEPVRRLEHRIDDPDQFGTAVSGAELRAEFLRRSEGVTRVEQFQSTDWAMDFYRAQATARITGRSLAGWGSIALMTDDAPSRWYGSPARRGMLVITPPGEAIDGCIVPGFRSISVHVPPSVWERCRRLAAPDAECSGAPMASTGSVRQMAASCLDAFERRLLALREQLVASHGRGTIDAAHAAGRALTTELITVARELQSTADAVAPRAQRSPQHRAWIARCAEEWLRARLHEPLAIPDVCVALRVSRRELEYAFRQAFDQSPREFLEALRLNAIHRALCARPPGGPSVTQIALEHGVTHLGRFAARYRQLFGELPSQSSRR